MKIQKRTLIRILEFFVIGLGLGIIEDLIVIKISTDATITSSIIWVAFFVALPFAIISELIVDHPNFKDWIFNKKKDSR